MIEAYSSIRHICNGVLLGHDPKKTRVFVVSGYSVYLDVSGDPVSKPFVVLGGFIASEDRWIAFERAWKEILRVRKINFPFHATDFFFERKDDPKLKHILADLVRTITNHIEAAFSSSIDIEAYKELNREYRLEEFAGTPYAITTRLIYKTVDDWQKTAGSRYPILYFVEDGTLHKGDMMDCLRDRDGLAPPIPVKKDNSAAQAADLYAYAVYQSCLLNDPADCFRLFMEKLPSPRERVDTRTFREELNEYISRKCTVVNTEKYPEGIRTRIPTRKESESFDLNFKGNKNKLRRATVGIPKS
jgi:hypothetical protein